MEILDTNNGREVIISGDANADCTWAVIKDGYVVLCEAGAFGNNKVVITIDEIKELLEVVTNDSLGG